MKILVSACLIGENCKYNGKNNYCEKLVSLLRGHEVISVCPEVLGGLPVPRDASEIVSGRVVTCTGRSVDDEFRRGAEKALATAIDEKVDMAVLQSRSPSCGVKEIYDGTFSGRIVPGKGVFARMLEENGIKTVDVEDV